MYCRSSTPEAVRMDGQSSDDARVYQNEAVCHRLLPTQPGRLLQDGLRVVATSLSSNTSTPCNAHGESSFLLFWKPCELAFVINLAFWTSIG